KMCCVNKKNRLQLQRLLKNMGAHTVVLELLQIPYEKLCNEISDRVVHHFVHCIETHGRHVQYLKFLQTIVKCDGKYMKKCQDKVMTEVGI
ncbi:hypothetical protein XENOCAPTIV_026325, partial [Xenoophorus captivus]